MSYEVLNHRRVLSAPASKFSRSKFFFVVVLGMCGFAGLIKRSGVVGTALLATIEEVKAAAARSWSCSEFDDDTTFTNVTCRVADEQVCEDSCYKCGWCSTLCKSECDRGSGVVCAMELLSNLTSTCALLSSMESAMEQETAYHVSSATATGNASLSFDNLTEISGACDKHTMCEFCTGDCRELININTTHNYGSMAVTMLCSLPRVCTEYGYR